MPSGGGIHASTKPLPPDQYLELRYEDVCADPKASAARVAEFIGQPARDFGTEAIDRKRALRASSDADRADHVWDICGTVAQDLGYSKT